MRALHIALAATLLLPALGACQRSPSGPVGSPERPLVLVLAPSHTPDAEVRTQLAAALSAATDLTVQVRTANTDAAAIALAGTERGDAFLTSIFGYLFAHELHGAEALVQVVRDGETSFRGEILVRADAGIATLADLEGRVVAYVTRYSTSGYVIPAKTFAEAGVKVEGVFAGSHEAAVERLVSGKAHAAAVHIGAVDAAAKGLVRLSETVAIPNEPVFARAGLDAQIRERLATALMELGEHDEGRALIGHLANATGFATPEPEAFARTQAMIEAIGKQVPDLIPDGWWMKHMDRASPADLGPY